MYEPKNTCLFFLIFTHPRLGRPRRFLLVGIWLEESLSRHTAVSRAGTSGELSGQGGIETVLQGMVVNGWYEGQ